MSWYRWLWHRGGRSPLRSKCSGRIAGRCGCPRYARLQIAGVRCHSSGGRLFSSISQERFGEGDPERPLVGEDLVSSIWDGSLRRNEVHRDVEARRRRGLLASPKERTNAITLLGREGLWEEALALLFEDDTSSAEASTAVDAIVWSAAVAACSGGSAWEQALQLLTDAKRSGQDLNVVAYSAAVSACGKAAKWEHACALLVGLPVCGLEPNVIIVNAAISGCARGGQWRQAALLLDFLREHALEPDVITYNAAVSACEKGWRWLEALVLMEDMRRESVIASGITYNAAISACGACAQWEQSLRLFGHMQQDALAPDAITCKATMDACVRGQQWQHAVHLFGNMPQLGIEPNDAVLGSLVSACGQGRQWTDALGTALHACLESHRWESALSILDQIRQADIDADVHAYNNVASACERNQQWEHAMRTLLDLGMRGPGADERSLDILYRLPWLALPSVDTDCRDTGARSELERELEKEGKRARDRGSERHEASVDEQQVRHEVEAFVAVPQRSTEETNQLEGNAAPTKEEEEAEIERQRAEAGRREALEAVERRKAEEPSPEQSEKGDEDGTPVSYKALSTGDALIDLHGLPVEVAKIAVQVAIEDLIVGPGPGGGGPQGELGDLIIVTGVGKHSPGGMALVRPAVIEFLRDALRILVLETRQDGPGRLRVPAAELRKLRGVPNPRGR